MRYQVPHIDRLAPWSSARAYEDREPHGINRNAIGALHYLGGNATAKLQRVYLSWLFASAINSYLY